MTELALKRQSLISNSIKEILIPVQSEIAELEATLHELIDSEVPFVRTVAEYILNNGGKRLRPTLTVVCAKMAGFSGKRLQL